MNAKETIYLIDGDYRRRAALTHCLASSGIHVEPFEDISEFMGRLPHEGLLVVHDDGSSVRRLLDMVRQTEFWLPVIGLAENPATQMIVNAVLAGAIDYVAWPVATEELLAVLAEARARAEKLAPIRSREVRARSRVDSLSRREREVLSGVTTGMSNRAIADHLGISTRTVEIHRANMLTKMNATSTSEAVRIACEAQFA
ncbi:MAG: LuxR family transcriptional regulator [Sphingomonadales bacterium]|nr:LuxR family transcriptional regulator [Sphingomonadales bacterium]